jgi:hypothetical protein
MDAFEIIWKQIEETFTEEAQKIREQENFLYNDYISKVIESCLSVDNYFKRALGEKEYMNDEYYRDISTYKMLIQDKNSEEFKLTKSPKCDFYIDQLITNYIERLKWKLQKSVYHYLAGIEMESINKNYFTRYPNFSGSWSFVTTKGEKGGYETKTIIAEGIKIRAHYRYISHVFGKVDINQTLRAKHLKYLESIKPKAVYVLKEEKEYAKRLDAAERGVLQAKRNIEYYEEEKRKAEAKKYTESNDYYEIQLERYKKSYEEAIRVLEIIMNTTVEDIAQELELKADKKRIKELKHELSWMQNNNKLDRYTEKIDLFANELNTLYIKRPEIKQKEIRTRINYIKREVEYIKNQLEYYKICSPVNVNENHQKNISNDLIRYEAELKIIELK